MTAEDTLLPFGHRDKQQMHYSCPLCKDTGDVLACVPGDSRRYAFLCSCPRGRNSKKRFSPWPGPNAGYAIIE